MPREKWVGVRMGLPRARHPKQATGMSAEINPQPRPLRRPTPETRATPFVIHTHHMRTGHKRLKNDRAWWPEQPTG